MVLKKLRLVDKDWCSTATPALFQRLLLKMEDAVATERSLARLAEISNSDYAGIVRCLVLCIQDAAVEEHDVGPTEHFKRLIACMNRFPALSRLCVIMDYECCYSFFAHALRILSESPRITHLLLAVRASMFQSLPPDALVKKWQQNIPEAASGLRHLEIEITAGCDEDMALFQCLRPDGLVLSTLSALLAGNLVHLKLEGGTEPWVVTNVCTASLRNLQTLELDHVALTAGTIVEILGNCRHSLGHVELDLVGITRGTWVDVFAKLSELTSLRFLRLRHCLYFNEYGNRDRIVGYFVASLYDPDEPDIPLSRAGDFHALSLMRDHLHARFPGCKFDGSSALDMISDDI